MPLYDSGMRSAYGLFARLAGAVVFFLLGALLGYILMLKLLIAMGGIFHDSHPSMQGFGYFMMSLATAVVTGLTASLAVLTMPWIRPVKSDGKGIRIALSLLLLFFTFILLGGQGHALIFVLGIVLWLAIVLWLTFVRCGLFDDDNSALPN